MKNWLREKDREVLVQSIVKNINACNNNGSDGVRYLIETLINDLMDFRYAVDERFKILEQGSDIFKPYQPVNYTGEKVAIYTGTRNLYASMIPAIKSLLLNSDVDTIQIFAEDNKITDDPEFPKDIVKIHNVKRQSYFLQNGPNMSSGFTYMAMMRAALAKEFPNLDRILSLDVDTIVDGDISDLWDLPIGDEYYLSASVEPSRSEHEGYSYVNIGVALYNLKKLRDGMVDKVIEELNTNRHTYVEQDVFNILCEGQILEMDPIYNSTKFTEEVKNAKIVHYAGIRKWHNESLIMNYRTMPWDYIRRIRKGKYGK